MPPGTPSPGGAGPGPELELSPEPIPGGAPHTPASPEPGAEASPAAGPESPGAATPFQDDGTLSSRSSGTTSTELTTSSSAASRAKGVFLESALRTATALKEQKNVSRKGGDPRSRSAPTKKGQHKPQHGKSPRKSVLGPQAVAKCHHQIAEHMGDKIDLENTLHFCFWAKDIFKVLYELFRYPDASGKYIRCRAVPVEEFVSYIARYGFNGDCVAIVREIYKCAPPHVIDSLNTASPGAPAYEITMPMLQKFIRINEHLTAGLEWAPVNEFKNSLMESRGSYLRAWRLDIDIFNTGTVPYMTFIQACHRLQHGHHSQAIWNAFRPDSTTAPLELAEFAPDEAANLEAFIQVLWVSCAFNMYKAWERIDVSERLWVSELEFTEGAKELGFEGDASLIFRGLDTYGLGRLWRRELEYLKTLFNASSRTPHGSPQIRVLRAWVTEQFKTPDVFLRRLGMDEGSTAKLSSEQLTSGLTQLGYPGDAAEAAHLVARAAGITSEISRDLLYPLVAGERPTAPAYIQRTMKSFKDHGPGCKPKKPRSVTPTPAEREKSWNASVDDLCERNENRPACHRYYFGYCPPLRPSPNGETAPRTPRKHEPKPAMPAAPKGTNMRVSFKVEPPNSDEEKEKKEKKERKEKKEKKEKKSKDADDDECRKEKKEKKPEKEKKDKKDKKDKKGKKDKDDSDPEELDREVLAAQELAKQRVEDYRERQEAEADNLEMGDEPTF